MPKNEFQEIHDQTEGTARNVPKTGYRLFEVSRTVIGYGVESFSGTIRGCIDLELQNSLKKS